MIKSKKELLEYLNADAKANKRKTIKPRVCGDRIWKFIVILRKLEYYRCKKGFLKILYFPIRVLYEFRFNKLSLLLGYSIPVGVIGKGFAIAHVGTIVINDHARLGENCRIHEGVTIGSTNGSSKAPQIGNNVFLASGAKVIGDLSIADSVAIGANAVVVKSIEEAGTTWGGVPAKKISQNNSHMNLSPYIFQ